MAELDLDTLESRGLIRVATIDPELEYLFRHALVQDAAYDSLLKQERRALHHQVGSALEQLYPDRHTELSAVLARHFEQAGETDKAIEYLAQAAQFAWQRNAITEAYELYTRASTLLPAIEPGSTEPDDRRLEVELGRLKSGFSFLDDATLTAMVPMLEELADRSTDLRLAADAYINIALLRSFRAGNRENAADLERALERVTQLGRELNDPLIDAVPKSLIGLADVFSGKLREGVETLRDVAPLLAQKRDFVGSSFALMALAMGLARMGRFDEAHEAGRGASELAESGDIIARLDALIGTAVVNSAQGNLDEAVRIGTECSELAQQTGAAACLVSSNFFLGDALMRKNQFGEAKISFERSGAVADLTDFKVFRPTIAAYLRSTMASLGATAANTLSFDEALAEARSLNDEWAETTIIWKRAETAAKQREGNEAQILADYEHAAQSFERMGARPFHARVLRDYGRELRAQGRTEEAAEVLRQAAAILAELGLAEEADELRLELD
jgi:tetratricopeptide (TPR) repeat protein